jgi:hypothetical protein
MDLSALSNVTTTIPALSSLILVSPQRTVGYRPQNPPGTTDTDTGAIPTPSPPALLFHYTGEERVDLESDITDHYAEDNIAYQDMIALKPETVTVKGFIGELNNVLPAYLSDLKTAADKLALVGAYAPQVSLTAIEIYNAAFQVYQTVVNAVTAGMSTYNLITGGGGENVIGAAGLGSAFTASSGRIGNWQTKQQTAFQQFYGYWRARYLFTVQTPWAIFENMAIARLQAVQEEGSSVVTDFMVTFKMIRLVKSAFDPTALQGRAGAQGAPLADGGTASPTDSASFSDKLQDLTSWR